MKRLFGLVLSGAVLGALSLASLAQAATFVVTRFDDPAPGACDSDCSLREAVIAANAAGGGDDVQLSTGTYDLTIAENGLETGGSLDIAGDLNLLGAGVDATVINGVQPGMNGRIIEVDSGTIVTIDGLTVQNGVAPGSVGGGLLATSTSLNLTLSNCRFTGNLAGDGGGVSSNAMTTVRNCRFDNNDLDATGSDGAGLAFSSSAALVVEDSVFELNEIPQDGRGAGLFFGGGASLTISGSRFEGNKLLVNGSGAGIHCIGNDPVAITDTLIAGNTIEGGLGAGAGLRCDASDLQLGAVTVADNTTDGGEYAGIFISADTTELFDSTISGNRITAGSGRYPAGFVNSELNISRSTIQNNANEGSGDGGGLWVVDTLTVVDSTFSGNRTNGNAGALELAAGTVNITNTTFSGNESGNEGGALRIGTGNGSFNNVTISGNTASGPGGGVFFSGFSTFTIRNSILSGNEDDGSGPDCNSPDSVTSAGYNLFGIGMGCNINPPEGDVASADIYGADALLGALADNGGPTRTLALLAGSPAIDAGNPAGCTDQNGDPLTIDQRGAPRPFGDRCDIGAVEFGSAPANTSNLSLIKTVDDDDVFLEAVVTFTLTVENQGPAANTNVVVTDALPAGFALVSATGAGADCAISGPDVTCTAATLAAAASFTVTIVATAEEAGDWVNTAEVSGDVDEFDPADNVDSVMVTIGNQGPIIGGSGCMLGGGTTPASMFSLGWLLVLAGTLVLRRRGR